MLEQEVVSLGFSGPGQNTGRNRDQGSMQDAMELNLHLRTGLRVLFLGVGISLRQDPDDFTGR